MDDPRLHDSGWDDAKAAPVFLVFKHSTRCPVSAAAYGEWRAWREAHPDTPTALVDVIEQRPLSQRIAAETGVEHQSPQAIWLVEGRAVWSASHYGVEATRLERARPDGT